MMHRSVVKSPAECTLMFIQQLLQSLNPQETQKAEKDTASHSFSLLRTQCSKPMNLEDYNLDVKYPQTI